MILHYPKSEIAVEWLSPKPTNRFMKPACHAMSRVIFLKQWLIVWNTKLVICTVLL